MNDGELVSIVQYTDYLVPEFESNGLNHPNLRGAIGSDYMTITIAVQRINTDNPSYDSFKFTTVADWISAPLFRREDAFALAWSDNFSQINSTCKAYYNSVGYISGKTSMIDSTPEAGVCYSVDCAYYYGQALDYVTLVANVRKPNATDTAVVAAKYGHVTINLLGEISVSIGKEPSISFSPTSSIDTMAKDTSFIY